MRPQLAELLGALTGDEHYQLASRMSRAATAVASVLVAASRDGKPWRAHCDLLADITDVQNDVLIQTCRIPVTLDRARRIVEASAFGRHHPVPVHGVN